MGEWESWLPTGHSSSPATNRIVSLLTHTHLALWSAIGTPSGQLNMVFLLAAIVGFQVLATYLGIAREGYRVSFLSLLLLNMAHYLVLFLFDTLVIDGLVLAVWRPSFLQLPEAMGG